MHMAYSSTTSIVINAPREKVWDALTKPEIVKQYFFGTDMDTTWDVGTPIFFRGEWEGKPYEDKGTVLEYTPPESLSYNYWSGFSGLEDKPELYQIIRFDLTDEGEGTKLTISQSNVTTQETADHSAQNWNMVFGGMKKLLET
jgi:uncharacterized protein YndB with AHSA1/START domain